MSDIAPSPWLEGGSSSFLARLYRAGEWDMHRGVQIVIPTLRRERKGQALIKIAAALDLLHQVAPAQLARLPHVIHSIAVGSAHGAAACWRRDLRAILIDPEVLLATRVSVAAVSTCPVHELMHARLERAGFEYEASQRARIERICRLAERNFIARLPDSADRRRLQRANARHLASQADDWSDAAFAARHSAWLANQPIWRRLLLTSWAFLRRAHPAREQPGT